MINGTSYDCTSSCFATYFCYVEVLFVFAHTTLFHFLLSCSYIYANNDEHQDVYRARIWSNNSILITFPAWEYSLLHNRDTYAAGLKGTKAPAGIIDAVDDALHTYHDNLKGNQESGCDVQRAGKNKHVLIEFNDNITLSAKVICNHDEQEDETKLPAFTFDEEYGFANDPGKVNSQSVVIFMSQLMKSQ